MSQLPWGLGVCSCWSSEQRSHPPLRTHPCFLQGSVFICQEAGPCFRLWHPLLTAANQACTAHFRPRLSHSPDRPIPQVPRREGSAHFTGLWWLPYFPSFGLRRTNKPSILNFLSGAFCCADSRMLLNGNGNRKQAAVWVICKHSEMTVFLLHGPSDRQHLPQIVLQSSLTGMLLLKITRVVLFSF